MQDAEYPDPDRAPNNMRPQQASHWTLFWSICGAVVVLYVAMRGYEGWAQRQLEAAQQVQRPLSGQPPTVAPSTSPTKDDVSRPVGPRVVSGSPEIVAPDQTRQVYKCVVDGKVTYSGRNDCRGGTKSALQITPEPEAADRAARQTQSRQMATATAAQAPDLQERSAVEQAAEQRAAWEAQQLAASRQRECADLDRRVKTLDSEARQPLSGQQQDQLRSDRQQARSRQFTLHC